MVNMRISVYHEERIESDLLGTGRPFKLDLRDRFVMLLVYYRLYITYTLAGFLFDLDQRTFAETFKR